MGKLLVFICTANTTRSPMAEAFARKMAEAKGSDWEIASAGMAAFPGVPVSSEAVATLKKSGIDITGQVSNPLSKAVVEGASLLVTLTGQHRDMIRAKMPSVADNVYALKELAGAEDNHDIKDPLDESQEFFDRIGQEIQQNLEKAWPILEDKMR
jgi:protein-tyrosine-phosphatase